MLNKINQAAQNLINSGRFERFNLSYSGSSGSYNSIEISFYSEDWFAAYNAVHKTMTYTQEQFEMVRQGPLTLKGEGETLGEQLADLLGKLEGIQ